MKYIFHTIVIIVTGLILMSNDNGVTTAQAKDRTGSPVGLTTRCNGCHTGASFSVTIAIRLKDSGGNVVTSYVPGQSYTFEVELTSSGAAVYGYQAVCLVSSTNANGGTLSAGTSNTKVVGLSGRTYGDHTAPSATGLFVLNWVAPASGTGTVDFYASGIGADNSLSTSGDKTSIAASLTITESPTGITEINKPQLQIYPNPTSGNLLLSNLQNGKTAIQIFNINGTKVESYSVNISNSTLNLDVEVLPAGTYFLQVNNFDNKSVNTLKFVKR